MTQLQNRDNESFFQTTQFLHVYDDADDENFGLGRTYFCLMKFKIKGTFKSAKNVRMDGDLASYGTMRHFVWHFLN